MTVKLLATSVAAVAAIGAAAAGVTSMTAGGPAVPQVRPVAVSAPLPLDPPPAPSPIPAPNPQAAQTLPTADQLTNILVNLSDPGVSYTDKTGLVEGGIGSSEGHLVDHELRKAARDGDLPLSFNVANITAAGPNTASAEVTISGPKIPAPVTKTVTFVNQGGWMLSRDSAVALVQEATAY